MPTDTKPKRNSAMKGKSAFKMLNFMAHIVGIFPFDARGRPTGWYTVTVILMCLGALGQVLYWSDFWEEVVKTPFYLLVCIAETTCLVAGFASYGIVRTNPVHAENLQEFERRTKIPIDYPVKWMIANVYMLPLFHTIKIMMVFVGVGFDEMWPNLLGYFLPKTVTQIGMMYYCSVLRMLHGQLQKLSESKLNSLQKIAWHSYLVQVCNTAHDNFRYQIIFGVFAAIAGSVRGGILFCRGYMTCRQVGGKYCSAALLGTLFVDIADNYWTLYCLTSTCYYVKKKAAECIRDDMELRLARLKPNLDVRLSLYILRVPEFITDVHDFFDPSPRLFLTILGESVIFFLLMVQLEVIKPFEVPSMNSTSNFTDSTSNFTTTTTAIE